MSNLNQQDEKKLKDKNSVKECKNKETENKNKETENKEKELTELLQRTQASFENFRKQMEKRIEEIKEMAAKDVILQVLPILDGFDLALKSIDSNPNDFIQGMELIYSQFKKMLEDSCVEEIITENQDFNPKFHEALMKVDSELPENKIIEEFQKGFTLHNQVIRHARVKISSGNKPKETIDTGDAEEN